MNPTIRIADTQFAHSKGGSFGTGDLNLLPSFFNWYRGDKQIGDIIVITESCFHLIDSFKEKIKIGLIIEPPSINANSYREIRNKELLAKFDYVLTYDPLLLKYSNKFVEYVFGGCWIEPDSLLQTFNKTKYISMIASNKKITEGHQLRWDIINKLNKYIDVYGRGHNYIENKLEGLGNYMFSIVVENDKRMLTEKLIDCLVTETIPIYWGPDYVESFFDMDGIVTFENIDDLTSQISVGENALRTFYLNRYEAIRNNCIKAMEFMIPEDRIWNNFLKDVYENSMYDTGTHG